MLHLNEDRWQEIKHQWLPKLHPELEVVPLIDFDHKTNHQEKIGEREIYTFSFQDKDYRLILDKEYAPLVNEHQKHGHNVRAVDRDPQHFIYKMRVQYLNNYGTWVDASALEDQFET